MIVFNTKLDLEEYITSMTSVRLSPGAIYMGLPCLFPSSGTLQIHAPDLGLASQWLGWLVVGAAALDDLDTSVELGDISVGIAPSFSLKTVLKPSCCFSNMTGPDNPDENVHCTHETTRWAGSPTEWYERNAPGHSRRTLSALGRSSCAAPDNAVSWHYRLNVFITQRQ